MNEFGRIQLEKYGWKTGAGLGKQEDGIKEAIKPCLKFDKCGVGHDPSEQFTFQWWDHAFNNAAKNIEVMNGKNLIGEDGNQIDLLINLDIHVSFNSLGILIDKVVNVIEDKVEVRKKKDEFEISTKKSRILPSLKKTLTYGSFVKTGTMTASGKIISSENSNEATTSSNEDTNSKNTDEAIFKKCSGRTAHRAARHGIKMNGKLMRIMKQEQETLCAKVSSTFHKRDPVEEKQDKVSGIRQSIKKYRIRQEAPEHKKHSLDSTVSDSSSNFISSTVGHIRDVASKIKKKKSKHM